MTFALGTPQRGQTIALADDRFAIDYSLAILDPLKGWEDPQKIELERLELILTAFFDST